VAAFAAWLVNQGIGELFFRPRPFAAIATVRLLINKSALDKSFPSDHAALAFALAGAILLINRRWGWTFIAIAALISIARVYVGVHYPSDVLAGALIGLICAYLVHRLAHKALRTKHHSPQV
jgi:undecaprenyl-diphosphatase